MPQRISSEVYCIEISLLRMYVEAYETLSQMNQSFFYDMKTTLDWRLKKVCGCLFVEEQEESADTQRNYIIHVKEKP